MPAMIASIGDLALSSKQRATILAVLTPFIWGNRSIALVRPRTVIAASHSWYPGSPSFAVRLISRASLMEKVPQSSSPNASAPSNDSFSQHWTKHSSGVGRTMFGATLRNKPEDTSIRVEWTLIPAGRRRAAVSCVSRCMSSLTSQSQNPRRASSSRSTAVLPTRARSSISRCSCVVRGLQGRRPYLQRANRIPRKADSWDTTMREEDASVSIEKI